MDFITVLTANGKRLAKTISDTGEVRPYDDAAYFLSMRQPVNNLDGLHAALVKLQPRSDSCVIRGSAIDRRPAAALVLKDGKGNTVDTFKGDAMRRRLETFPDVPHHWLMLDVDDETWAGESLEAGMLDWVAQNLPECFHEASFVWQLSSSAGIKPGLRTHLWFWLANAADSLSLREWGKAWNEHKGRKVIDTSIYSSVQAHYTADPILDDPFGLLTVPAQRVGLYDGLFSNVELDLRGVKTYAPVVPGSGTRDSDDINDDVLLNMTQPLDDVDEDLARKYLDKLDNDIDGFSYDEWLKVGMALKHQFGDAGFELFDEWSQRSAKYDANDCERRWKSFQTNRANAATFSSIIYLAGGRIKPETVEEAKATYDELAAEIKECKDAEVLTGRMVKRIGAAGLSETNRNLLLDQCRRQVKTLTGTLLSKSTFTAPLREQAQKGKAVEDIHLELGLSKRIIEQHFPGGRIKAIDSNFWLYEGGVWALRDDSVVRRYVFDALKDMLDRGVMDDQFVESLIESDRTDRLGALVDAIVKLIRDSVSEVSKDPLELMKPVSHSVINCKNGEVWFKKNGDLQFKAHDPKNNLTQQIACEFDADAECPTWDAAVERVFKGVPDQKAVVTYWYEMLGYMIQPTRSAGEAWMLMKGPGGNGKSFLMEIVQTIMGEACVEQSMAELTKSQDPHFSAKLVGKLLLIDDDFKAKGLLPDDWMKKLTGQKTMTANPKYQRCFNFMCRTMVVILANGWPASPDTTGGMRRRANVFEVHHVLADGERDPQHRTTIIEKELPGVLNRLIQGWQRVLKSGGKLRPPAVVDSSAERWMEHGSSALRFVRECFEPTFDDADCLTFKEAWSLYKQYTVAYDEHIHPVSRQGLKDVMANSGMKAGAFSTRYRTEVYPGWRIKEGVIADMAEEAGL